MMMTMMMIHHLCYEGANWEVTTSDWCLYSDHVQSVYCHFRNWLRQTHSHVDKWVRDLRLKEGLVLSCNVYPSAQEKEFMSETHAFFPLGVPPVYLPRYIDAIHMIKWSRPSPFMFAYNKRSETGPWEGLAHVIFSQICSSSMNRHSLPNDRMTCFQSI